MTEALLVPDKVQTPTPEVASNEKTTGFPDPPPVAERDAEMPTVPGDGALKVMVWTRGTTVSVAGPVVAVPPVFVKTASYSFPLCSGVGAGTTKVSETASATGFQVAPPSVDTCHWTVGTGLPEAAAVKVASWPAVTLWLVGAVVTTGEA